jgi:hypothetical protein
MQWADMDQSFAEGSYEMAVTSWSNTGAANPQGVQIAMEEDQNRAETRNATRFRQGFRLELRATMIFES